MAMAGMSAAEKSFQLQMQMKRNTEEMSSFLKEMSDWTRDVSQKDEQLKSSNKPDSALPPVRAQPKPRKKKKKKKKQVTIQESERIEGGEKKAEPEGDKKSGKIKGYDYRAWDKFDVDAAIKEIDGDASKMTLDEDAREDEEEGSTDDEEMMRLEEEKRQQLAVYHKEKGNEFFKLGKWEEAVECYTKGLQQDALNAVLFANRAMALLKLQKYAAAIADCDCSIELDDTYTKAYLRRATAHLKLEHKTEALADFNKVLEFEPENKLAMSTVKKLEVELTPAEEYTPRKPGDITNMKRTLPPSDKPMVRIQIIDISPEDFETKPKGKKGIEEISSEVEVEVVKTKKEVLSAPKKTKEASVVQFESLPTRVPMNYLQFQTDTRKLKSHPDKLFEYIKQIDPDIYPKLFQDSLEADNLFMILETLNSFYIPNRLPVYSELYYLTKVRRFDMAIMFKTEHQQLIIGQLVQYAAETADDKLGIIGLIKAYNILDLSKYKLNNLQEEVEI